MNISESTQVYCKCIDPQVLPSFLMAKLYVSLEDLENETIPAKS